MSLILDALNRADQDRNETKSAPNLQTAHPVAPERPRPFRRWIIEGVIILFALAAISYAFFFLPDKDHTIPATPAITASEQEIEKPVLPAATKPAEAAATIQPVNDSTKLTESDREKSPKAPVVSHSKNKAKINSLYTAPPTKTVTTQNAKPAAKTNTVAISQTESEDTTQKILRQIPLLSQHPQRFQTSIPNLEYSIHMYSEIDGGGFVKINNSIQKIGSSIYPELRVIAILKDSVVLDYKGTQFRLLALNSWVNFN